MNDNRKDANGQANSDTLLNEQRLLVLGEVRVEIDLEPRDEGEHRVTLTAWDGSAFIDQTDLAISWKRGKLVEAATAYYADHFSSPTPYLTDPNGRPLILRLAELAANPTARDASDDDEDDEEEAGTDTRAEALDRLTSALQGRKPFRVVEIHQRGAQDSSYELVLEVDGERIQIDIGGARDVFAFAKIEAAMAEVKIVPRRGYTKKKWRRFAEMIFEHATVVRTTSRDEETASWVTSFIEEHIRGKPAQDPGEIILDAKHGRNSVSAFPGFVTRDDRVFISANALAKYVRLDIGARTSIKDLATRLTRIGFAKERLDAWVKVKDAEKPRTITQRFWVGPLMMEGEA